VSANSRVKAHIADLSPYVPGKPIEELERELGISGTVKLASNENPLGPSPKAMAAMEKAVAGVHRYPDGASFALRNALAERLGVGDEQLVFGAGSDEILELISKAFLGAGDEVVFAWPSFAMYPIVAKGMAATPVMVPLNPELVHDLDAMAKAVTSRTQMVFVCNPNNPTGTSVGREAFDRFVAEIPDDLLLVVDEAYVEYVRRDDFPDAMAWVARRPGTAVLRTFSKIYGLAALDDDAHVERSRQTNEEGIAFLRREMDALGIRTWDSDANFVLAEAGAGIYEDLLPMGIIVRPMAGFGLPECIRITVGTDTENRRVIESLRALRSDSRSVGP
jgi:histidinol-phosphate aminotransferase